MSVEMVSRLVSGPLRIFEYHGQVVCDGLFKLHDQMGFSLSDALIECRRRGWIPAIKQFVLDAMQAGWSERTILSTLREANADGGSQMDLKDVTAFLVRQVGMKLAAQYASDPEEFAAAVAAIRTDPSEVAL